MGCLVAIALFFWLPQLGDAQTGRLESRVSRLEAQNVRLRNRLDRLEAALARVDRSQGGLAPPPPAPDLDPTRPQDPSLDAMFDNLATLAIELKERIQVLEAEVDELQSRLPRGASAVSQPRDRLAVPPTRGKATENISAT